MQARRFSDAESNACTENAAHPDSVGKVRSFHGNFLVVVRALTYMLSLGREGIPAAATGAVLNANYLKALLAEKYTMATI